MLKAYKIITITIISLLLSLTVTAAELDDASLATVDESATAAPDNKFNIKFGGVVRFSYNYSDWKEGQQTRGGDIMYDVFGLSTTASYNDIFMSAEYRQYADYFGGGFLKHGYIGYNFSATDNLQFGLTQVPFGVTKYNSNSFFFSLACYAGFEDDYDMGLKYTHVGEAWEYSLAFFKNAEDYGGAEQDASSKRYAYDIASYYGTYRNKEVNHGNAQVFYNIHSGSVHHRIGASAQYGGIYNLETMDIGSHYAYALHYELSIKQFNLKAQAMSYSYDAASPDGEDKSVISVGAYGAPYMIAAEAQIYTIGVSYNFPVDLGPVTSLKVYNDYGYMAKESTETMKLYDSSQNVTGVAISAGPIYSYIDYAMGKNHSWLGADWDNAFGEGQDVQEWSKRFNISVGYYF